MSNKKRNKRIGIGPMVIVTCIAVVGFWAVMATPEITFGAKPGNIPACIEFGAGGGIQSDDGPYCDDKQLKVEAIMTPDGHFNLFPNTGRGEGRILKVYTDLDPVTPLKGWRFLVGGWQDGFDMRDMEVGEDYKRTDVNLLINSEAPPNEENEVNWLLAFDPSRTRWGIDYSKSTYVTVTRTSVDTWEVQNGTVDESGNPILSQAVLVIQTQIKNKSVFTYGGVVIVPPFTATVTLVP